MAVLLADVVASEEKLLDALLAARDARCESPEAVTDVEVGKIASWAWHIRCEDRLYRERGSEFRVHRQAVDRLKGQPRADDAIAFYVSVLDLHGDSPGKTFFLKCEGARTAGYLTMSKRRFMTAHKRFQAPQQLCK